MPTHEGGVGGVIIYSQTCVNPYTHTTATTSGPWPWPAGSAIMGDHPPTHIKALVIIDLLRTLLPLGRESSEIDTLEICMAHPASGLCDSAVGTGKLQTSALVCS